MIVASDKKESLSEAYDILNSNTTLAVSKCALADKQKASLV